MLFDDTEANDERYHKAILSGLSTEDVDRLYNEIFGETLDETEQEQVDF